MTVIFPVSTKDAETAFELSKWINELGGCKGHDVIFCYDARCYPGTVDAIGIELAKAFDKVHPLPAQAKIDSWPQGANYMFGLCATTIQTKPNTPYWFWMEPDTAPLRESWLDLIETEHKRGGKPFTGGRVEGIYNGAPVPLHMTGIAVYPNPLCDYAGEAYRAYEVAWDIAGKDQIVPKANFTKLICHAWRHPGFRSMKDLDQIPQEAVIHHGVKDGSLLNLLRQKRSGKVDTIEPVRKEPVLTPGSPAPLASVEGGDPFFSATKKERFGDVPKRSAAPEGVHVVTGDVWVLNNDMISGIINQRGRLDCDDLLPKILPYIKEGDTVIDGGAFVGDHTIAYSRAVGDNGTVHAFEPNPVAYECLKHNIQGCTNVGIHRLALGGSSHYAPLEIDEHHQGGAHIGSFGMHTIPVTMIALDSLGFKPDVIKLDLEGFELFALQGAEKTIAQHQPTLILEINEEALLKQKTTPQMVLDWLKEHQYEWTTVLDYKTETALYDIVALPSGVNHPHREPHVSSPDAQKVPAPCQAPPPKAMTYGDMIACIIALKAFAAIDTNHRMRVMKNLSANGLVPKGNLKRNKHRKRKPPDEDIF